MVYYIVYFLTKFLSLLFFPLKIEGREHIPPRGGFLLAGNHVSYLDPVILGICTGRRVNFMAKEELFRNGLLGFVLPRLGAFPVRRDSADRRALKEACRRLKDGKPIVLFPEGTRFKSGTEPTAQPGVGFIAAHSGCPVIPTFVSGSEKVLPPNAKFLHRRVVTVRFGPPHVCQGHDYQGMAQDVIQRIYQLAPTRTA